MNISTEMPLKCFLQVKYIFKTLQCVFNKRMVYYLTWSVNLLTDIVGGDLSVWFFLLAYLEFDIKCWSSSWSSLYIHHWKKSRHWKLYSQIISLENKETFHIKNCVDLLRTVFSRKTFINRLWYGMFPYCFGYSLSTQLYQ